MSRLTPSSRMLPERHRRAGRLLLLWVMAALTANAADNTCIEVVPATRVSGARYIG
jgi:hypothetical protein